MKADLFARPFNQFKIGDLGKLLWAPPISLTANPVCYKRYISMRRKE